MNWKIYLFVICYLLSYKCLDASYHRGYGLARLSLEYWGFFSNWQKFLCFYIQISVPFPSPSYGIYLLMLQSGDSLFKWQPARVEGGGGWRASKAKELSTSHLGRRYPLPHRWTCRFDPSRFGPSLGPRGWDLASSWISCCAEILACSRCSANVTCKMLISEIKTKNTRTRVLFVGPVSFSQDLYPFWMNRWALGIHNITAMKCSSFRVWTNPTCLRVYGGVWCLEIFPT